VIITAPGHSAADYGCRFHAELAGDTTMRVFVASHATETNTFAPLPVDRAAFEAAFYAPPRQP
jgi:hypothetical protein